MTYAGGKSGHGVYHTLINLMPPHRVYIEPFLGGGAVMRLKRPAEVNIGLDKDPEVVRWWRGLVATPKAARVASSGGNARDRSTPGGTADSYRRGAPDSPMTAARAELAAIAGVSVIHADGIRWLREYPFEGDELVYCDPPYLMGTRSSKRALYDCEMTDREHQELLKAIKGLKCHVMISGYSSVLYARELKSWNAFAFGASTRGGLAAEWVWCNYPRPAELHDYRFLGDNWRERQDLKRQQQRWVARLGRMSTLQRQALLAAISTTRGESRAAK